MNRVSARIRGAFFITRQANHHLVHISLGFIWFYLLNRFWTDLSSYHLFLAIVGSELPDLEHGYYWFVKGKSDEYSIQVKEHLRNREWRNLVTFLKENHKYLTTLHLHSLGWVLVLVLLCVVSFFRDREASLVLFGSMLTHYCFDMLDDIIFLGKLNPNWMRGVRIKRVQKEE